MTTSPSSCREKLVQTMIAMVPLLFISKGEHANEQATYFRQQLSTHYGVGEEGDLVKCPEGYDAKSNVQHAIQIIDRTMELLKTYDLEAEGNGRQKYEHIFHAAFQSIGEAAKECTGANINSIHQVVYAAKYIGLTATGYKHSIDPQRVIPPYDKDEEQKIIAFAQNVVLHVFSKGDVELEREIESADLSIPSYNPQQPDYTPERNFVREAKFISNLVKTILVVSPEFDDLLCGAEDKKTVVANSIVLALNVFNRENTIFTSDVVTALKEAGLAADDPRSMNEVLAAAELSEQQLKTSWQHRTGKEGAAKDDKGTNWVVSSAGSGTGGGTPGSL